MSALIEVKTGSDGVTADLSLHWNSLYRYILKKVRDPALSEDIVQETFTRLYAYQESNRVDNAPALGTKIALNLVRDHFRLRRPTSDLDEQLVCREPQPDEIMIQRQRLAALQEVLTVMPALRRQIFTRIRLQGEAVAQIAAELAMTPGAVEKHLVRGLADLQRALDRHDRRGGDRR